MIHRQDAKAEKITEVKKQPIADAHHSLQAMYFEMPVGSEGKPHKHNAHKRTTTQTHEALVILKGSIELSIYDIDHSFVEKHILHEGDCYLLINGGHNIKILSDAQFFEFKNGPYYGPERDRTNLS